MNVFPRRARSTLFIAIAASALAFPAWARTAEPDGDNDGDDGPAKPITEVIVTAKRLDAARANVAPSLGASTYSLSNEVVESRPGSETTSLNQVLLQVPGVQQDGSGRLHVRQAQGDLQYRINNVIIPEGMSDLGESLSARIAQKVELVTGALPAQYGFQAGGVVNVTTKNGVYLNGGQAELYGGGHGEFEPAFEYGGSIGETNIFVSGSFLRNQVGLASLDGSANPSHDRTDQIDGFAFLDRALDSQTRVSLILGASDDRFQEPNLRGLTAPPSLPLGATYQGPLVVGGVGAVSSEQIDNHHRDAARWAIASLVHATDVFTLQASAFARQSEVQEQADGVGDLVYRGLGQAAFSRDLAYGLQVEGVYEAAAAHTLRGGLLVSMDRLDSTTTTRVLRVDAAGRQLPDVPIALAEAARPHASRSSAFLQDEWRLTDALTLNSGLRLDVANAGHTETALSPRLSLVWTSPAGATLHAGYAQYFLPAPTEDANEAPADLVGSTGAWPGPASNSLRSETDDYYDVGLQQTLGKWTLGVDGYWRAARNLIADGQFGPAYLARSFNYRSGRLKGVELSATYASGPWSAWANLAVAQARGRGIVSNQAYFSPAQLGVLAGWTPLAQDQADTASAGGAYHWGRVRLSGDLLYGSGLPRTASSGGSNSARLPNYAQVNLAAVYRAATFNQHPLDLRIDVMNAFDTRYALRDGAGIGDGPPQWGPRRGIFFGVEQSF